MLVSNHLTIWQGTAFSLALFVVSEVNLLKTFHDPLDHYCPEYRCLDVVHL
jgi:hypothetical protein